MDSGAADGAVVGPACVAGGMMTTASSAKTRINFETVCMNIVVLLGLVDECYLYVQF
jgi:hypothetical protein